MKKLALFVLLSACLGGTALAQKAKPNQPAGIRKPPVTQTPAQKEEAIKAAILKLEEANNQARVRGDGATLKTLYADDFAGINAAGGASDKANIVGFYSDDGPVVAVHSTDDTKIRVIGSNVAVVTTHLSYQYNDKLDDSAMKSMRYTRIYELRGTTWLVVAEHFCFVAQPVDE